MFGDLEVNFEVDLLSACYDRPIGVLDPLCPIKKYFDLCQLAYLTPSLLEHGHMDLGAELAVRYHEQVLLVGRLHERCGYWRLIKSDS